MSVNEKEKEKIVLGSVNMIEIGGIDTVRSLGSQGIRERGAGEVGLVHVANLAILPGIHFFCAQLFETVI